MHPARCLLLVLLGPALGLLLVILPSAADTPPPPPYSPGQICCLLEEGASIDIVNSRWNTVTLYAEPNEELYLLYADGVADLEDLVARMRSDEAIDIVEVNYVLESPEAVRQMVIGAVGGGWAEYADQALTTRIGLGEAHQLNTGAGITVAVLDSGVDPDHEALAGRLADYGFDCVDYDSEPWEEANAVDDDDDGLIDEGFGHGTMVAGLIALVAPDATIMPFRVLDDEGRGSLFGITKAMINASSHGAHLLNMSFGCPQVILSIQKRLRLTDQHGAIAVAGAGNRNQEDPPYYPASDTLSYMVTAVDSCDVKADFADYHADVFLAAPGVAVRSAYPEGEWGIGSGCSFATPLVTGEIALLLSHFGPDLPKADLEARLRWGVVAIDGLDGNASYAGKLGAGRILLPLALTEPAAGPEPEPLPRVHVACWPNPSRGAVYLQGDFDGATHRVSIYDVTGRQVRRLQLPPGHGSFWDGRDRDGRPVAPGQYWLRLGDGSRGPTLVRLP